MEFLLNFVWLALSLSILSAWLIGPYSPARTTRQDWARQAVALGILLLVLLPVVSLTDDLQSWTTPAEVEHGLRRADASLEASLAAESPILWLYLALPTPTYHPECLRRIDLGMQCSKPLMGVSHTLENRPPPSSI